MWEFLRQEANEILWLITMLAGLSGLSVSLAAAVVALL
jgi:hypothetical protein